MHGGRSLSSMRTCGEIGGARSVGRGLAMMHDRVGRDEHPRPGTLCAPAEVEIITEELQLGVESAEEVPDLPSDEHACRAH